MHLGGENCNVGIFSGQLMMRLISEADIPSSGINTTEEAMDFHRYCPLKSNLAELYNAFLDRHPRPWCPLSCGQCWSLQLAGWNVCEISLPEHYSDFDLVMNGLNNRHNWGVWRPGGFDLHQSVGCPAMGRFEPPSILGTSSLSTPTSGSTLPRFWV